MSNMQKRAAGSSSASQSDFMKNKKERRESGSIQQEPMPEEPKQSHYFEYLDNLFAGKDSHAKTESERNDGEDVISYQAYDPYARKRFGRTIPSDSDSGNDENEKNKEGGLTPTLQDIPFEPDWSLRQFLKDTTMPVSENTLYGFSSYLDTINPPLPPKQPVISPVASENDLIQNQKEGEDADKTEGELEIVEDEDGKNANALKLESSYNNANQEEYQVESEGELEIDEDEDGKNADSIFNTKQEDRQDHSESEGELQIDEDALAADLNTNTISKQKESQDESDSGELEIDEDRLDN